MAESPVRSLEQYLARVGKGSLTSLSTDELLDFGRSYRRASALLARARTAGLKGSDIQHLNEVLARAYPLVYAPPRRAAGGASALSMLLTEFPRAFRREYRAVLVAVGVFLLGACVGLVAVEIEPANADLLLGPGWSESLDDVAQRHMGDNDWLPESIRPMASAQIITNNIKVSFLAFSLGVLFCIGSLYVMAFNGVMLGAVAGVVHQHGTDLNFWSFVAPHGVLEIPAILIASTAGIVIGYAIIDPGRMYRSAALKLAARRAVPLILGVVVLLLVAGFIEGFFSPHPDIEPSKKLTFAALGFCTLCFWLGLAGMNSTETGGQT